MMVDHISRIPITPGCDGEYDLPIDGYFSDDHFLALATSSAPSYADLVNYMACGITLTNMNLNQKKRFCTKPNHILGRNLTCIRFTEMV